MHMTFYIMQLPVHTKTAQISFAAKAHSFKLPNCCSAVGGDTHDFSSESCALPVWHNATIKDEAASPTTNRQQAFTTMHGTSISLGMPACTSESITLEIDVHAVPPQTKHSDTIALSAST